MNVDVLAIGAHPDDVELGIGGLVHKLAQRGRRVALLDLTRGEMGSRGTPDERAEEARKAADILGAVCRENVALPDGGVANTAEQQRKLVPFLRKYRPAALFAPMRPDRHPDHDAAHGLVRDANYFAGLARIETDQEPWRAPRLYFYHPYFESGPPTFVVDISESFDAKMAALRAHASQFFNPEYDGPSTMISSKQFWDSIPVRAAYWGGRIQAAYGEALYADPGLALDLPPGV